MYVATPQGYRRRIGPRSRYGTTPDEPAYQRTSQRVGSSPQRVGSSSSGLDEHFGSEAGRRRKELDEREKADRYLFDREKRRSNQARKSEQTAKATSSATSAATTAAAGATGGPVAAGIHSVLAGLRSSSDLASRQRQAAEDRAKGRAKANRERRTA